MNLTLTIVHKAKKTSKLNYTGDGPKEVIKMKNSLGNLENNEI